MNMDLIKEGLALDVCHIGGQKIIAMEEDVNIATVSRWIDTGRMPLAVWCRLLDKKAGKALHVIAKSAGYQLVPIENPVSIKEKILRVVHSLMRVAQEEPG